MGNMNLLVKTIVIGNLGSVPKDWKSHRRKSKQEDQNLVYQDTVKII